MKKSRLRKLLKILVFCVGIYKCLLYLTVLQVVHPRNDRAVVSLRNDLLVTKKTKNTKITLAILEKHIGTEKSCIVQQMFCDAFIAVLMVFLLSTYWKRDALRKNRHDMPANE